MAPNSYEDLKQVLQNGEGGTHEAAYVDLHIKLNEQTVSVQSFLQGPEAK